MRDRAVVDGDGGTDGVGLAADVGHVGQEHRHARLGEFGVEGRVGTDGGGQVPGVHELVQERSGGGLADRPLEPGR